MITPEYLNRIMYDVEDKLSEVNEYLVARIAKRIMATFTNSKGDLFIPATINDIRKLMQNGLLYEDVEQAVTKALPTIQKEVKQAFLESADEICRQNLDIASKIVTLKGLSSVNVPKYEQVGIVREAEQLNMTPTEIRKLEMAYRRANGEIKNLTGTIAKTSQQNYIQACDRAWMKAQSGVSVQTAVTEALEEIADKGARIEYPSGHTDSYEVAVSRSVRTGVNQANSEIVLQRCAEIGVGYVKVSAHLGARVTKVDDYTNHSWWQGQVYSLDWSHEIFNQFKPSIQDDSGRFGWMKNMRDAIGKLNKPKYKDFVETCGYGDIQGIAGANCRHSFYPFYPGINIDTDDRPNQDDNERRYNLEQKQRSMERAIRKTKRELVAYQQDKEQFKDEIKRTRAKLHKQSDAYMDFCKNNDLKPRNMALKV